MAVKLPIIILRPRPVRPRKANIKLEAAEPASSPPYKRGKPKPVAPASVETTVRILKPAGLLPAPQPVILKPTPVRPVQANAKTLLP